MKQLLYVQYGCGLSAPQGWLNFDASPTLRIQRNPLLDLLLGRQLDVRFPDAVRYGDITRGLPGVAQGSCQGVYCSHVLEHLSLQDFRQALRHAARMLTDGGIFRCLVPDLEAPARAYCQQLDASGAAAAQASHQFLRTTLLGKEARARTLKQRLRAALGNANHLWMWVRFSLPYELEKVGFSRIRQCQFGDATDPMFARVESPNRFREAVAFEAIK